MAVLFPRVGSRLTLIFFPLLVLACRESSTDPSPSAAIPFTLTFSSGARFLYQGWTLDQFGYVVPPSEVIHTWVIRSTGTTLLGRPNTTRFIDSAFAVTNSSLSVDTVDLSVDPNGDVYLYGFLARLAATRENRRIPKQWDRIAAFSLGSGTLWTLGTWDSAGAELVTAQIAGARELFAVKVNGVQMVFSGYRIDLQSPSFTSTLAMSDAPSAILELVEEPNMELTGSYLELKEIVGGK